MTTDIVFTTEGRILPFRTDVLVNDKILKIEDSQKFIKHSSEFAWGYCGSGPSQTALAILLAIGLPFNEVSYMYHDFKNECIAKIPMDSNFKASIFLMIEGSKIIKIHMKVVEFPEAREVEVKTQTPIGQATDWNEGQEAPATSKPYKFNSIDDSYSWLAEMIAKDIDKDFNYDR